MELKQKAVPDGWRLATVGELSERVSVGYVSSTRAFFSAPEEGVPLIRSQNIRPGRLVLGDTAWVTRAFHDANPKSQLMPGDVLITRVGANAGDVCMVPDGVGEMHLSSAVFARPNSEHRKYIELFFRSPIGQCILKSRIVGSVSERINTRDVEALLVLLPPKNEEAAIAHILGTLDDKIELNRRMSATLEAMARALFKSWFVDFEPVRAKAEGRDSGLPPHLAALFPARLIETELGEIPEGWRWGPLGWIANNPRRSAQPAEIPEGTPYIGLEHMPRQSLALGEWARAAGVESNKYWFEKKQVLFGKLRPYFHKVGIAPVDGVCSTDIVVLEPSEPEWWSFLALVASSVEFVAFTDQGSTGTKMPRTSWPEMSRYVSAMPRREVAACFERMIRPSLERIVASVHQSRTLAALRDTLLPKLISGELRVQSAQRIVEAVA